jgi:hypothetical protein
LKLACKMEEFKPAIQMLSSNSWGISQGRNSLSIRRLIRQYYLPTGACPSLASATKDQIPVSGAKTSFAGATNRDPQLGPKG